jgi:hypothetical protein
LAAPPQSGGKGLPFGGPFFHARQPLLDRAWLTEIKPFRFYRRRLPSGDDRNLNASSQFLLRFAAALIGLAPLGQPALAATIMAAVSANNVKPLVLTKVQNLDLGMVALGPGVWSNATISLSQAGVLSCANTNVVCTGATTVAQYNVQGSNQQTVHISAPNVTLVNQSDASKTLTLVTDAPATLVLTNSGFPGVNFSIGGSVTLSSATATGTYVGTFNVTVDY